MFSGASGIVFEHPWTLNFRFSPVKFCYSRSTFNVGATSTLSEVAEVISYKPQHSFIDSIVFETFVNVLPDDEIANSLPTFPRRPGDALQDLCKKNIYYIENRLCLPGRHLISE